MANLRAKRHEVRAFLVDFFGGSAEPNETAHHLEVFAGIKAAAHRLDQVGEQGWWKDLKDRRLCATTGAPEQENDIATGVINSWLDL